MYHYILQLKYFAPSLHTLLYAFTFEYLMVDLDRGVTSEIEMGDVAEGNATGPIYKGNQADGNVANEVVIKDGKPAVTEEVEKKIHSSGHKEKSVLQAKLTKLAIQIGYAGRK